MSGECVTNSSNSYLQLVFASRVLLCFILCHVKLSNALLVLQIFTNSLKWMKIWFYTIIGGIAAQALLGPLTISAGCSATQVLLADRGALCSNNVCRPDMRCLDFTPGYVLTGLYRPADGSLSRPSKLSSRLFWSSRCWWR